MASRAYIKEGVSPNEHACTVAAATLGLAPRVLGYDAGRRVMRIEAGTVLDGYPEEMPAEVAKDVAELAVNIARHGLWHTDFHLGNMVYIGKRLVAIDWDGCPEVSRSKWVKNACDLVRTVVRCPWLDAARRKRGKALTKGVHRIRDAFEAIIRRETGDPDYRCVDPLAQARRLAAIKRDKMRRAREAKAARRILARAKKAKAAEAKKKGQTGEGRKRGGRGGRSAYNAFVRSVYHEYTHLPNRDRFSAIAAAWRARR